MLLNTKKALAIETIQKHDSLLAQAAKYHTHHSIIISS